MDPKTYGHCVNDLRRARACYQALRGYFEGFCAAAKRLHESHSDVKGVTVTDDQDGLLLTILDRRIRIDMHYDRKAGKGILDFTDVSIKGRLPQVIEHVHFDSLGETTVPGEKSGDNNLTLANATDCTTLVVRLLDLALDHQPWQYPPVIEKVQKT